MPNRKPLSAEQLDAFLTDGYLVLQPRDLGPVDHQYLYNRAAGLYQTAEATANKSAHLDTLGDNLRAQIPSLDGVLADPVIDGALTTLLGTDYLLHPHSYCHRSSERDQQFHQDGNLPWNERGHYRSHRPDWAMLFYYPQSVDATNGPTEVVPGSQYWTVNHETPNGGWHPDDRIDRSIGDDLGDDLDNRDALIRRSLSRGLGVPNLAGQFVHLPAGSVVLAHYDLIHRGSRTAGALDPRFMFKFYFARVRQPQPGQTPIEPVKTPTPGNIAPVVEANRRWLAGLQPEGIPAARSTANLDRANQALLSDREDLRVAEAYALGRAAAGDDQRAIETLSAALHAADEATRRAASHGLRQAGESGVPVLLRGLDSSSVSVRRPAVAGLATAAAAASPEALSKLIHLVAADQDILVRSNAAYCLGQFARSPVVDGERIGAVLFERLGPGIEPDNAFCAGFARSTVRQSAAYGLSHVLVNHVLTDQLLQAIVAGLETETDRYVEGLLIEGLARTQGLPSDTGRRLLRYLSGRRWNPPVSEQTATA